MLVKPKKEREGVDSAGAALGKQIFGSDLQLVTEIEENLHACSIVLLFLSEPFATGILSASNSASRMFPISNKLSISPFSKNCCGSSEDSPKRTPKLSKLKSISELLKSSRRISSCNDPRCFILDKLAYIQSLISFEYKLKLRKNLEYLNLNHGQIFTLRTSYNITYSTHILYSCV